eukprot:CAMPEP_0198145192 /NCGR_PEP_ID=MMETSP1443-20131203/21774_1 /TAXON_ID=186043 /ORGANISM="Entomoneis sp., Strain CCMP2396" /LENGTH=148 /DNA_ID=CAMNT_0043808759 /DNA_START=26 /DNA_END=472 /DNA_ORIENTATION=-
MKDLSYTSVSVVVDLWEACRNSNSNFDEEFGVVAFQKLFEIHACENPKTIAKFLKHAKSFVGVVDSIMQMMGPDTDFMQGILHSLGTRCYKLGAQGDSLLLTYIGDAMMGAMEQTLKRDFSLEEQEAFDEVCYVIVEEIRAGVILSSR